jgi:hypothetical protein
VNVLRIHWSGVIVFSPGTENGSLPARRSDVTSLRRVPKQSRTADVELGSRSRQTFRSSTNRSERTAPSHVPISARGRASLRGLEADQHELLVCFGSIASLWQSADYFRSSPGHGHCQGRSPCLKGANNGHSGMPAIRKACANFSIPSSRRTGPQSLNPEMRRVGFSCIARAQTSRAS